MVSCKTVDLSDNITNNLTGELAKSKKKKKKKEVLYFLSLGILRSVTIQSMPLRKTDVMKWKVIKIA